MSAGARSDAPIDGTEDTSEAVAEPSAREQLIDVADPTTDRVDLVSDDF